MFTIRLLTSERPIRRNRGSQFAGRAGWATILPSDQTCDLCSFDDPDTVSCTISQGALRNARFALEGVEASAPLEFEPVVELETQALRSFAYSVTLVHSRFLADAGKRDPVHPLLEELLLHQLLSSWPRKTAQRPRPVSNLRSHIVRRALEFIEQNLAQPIGVSDVAEAAGVSVRTLQTSFKKELQCTPLQHMIDLRLQKAQADIVRDPLASISEIARYCGFSHMSDFSRRYRIRFGRTPSEERGVAVRALS